MASLLSWLGKRAKAVEAQFNMFDNGKTYNTVMQNRAPAPRPVGPSRPVGPPRPAGPSFVSQVQDVVEDLPTTLTRMNPITAPQLLIPDSLKPDATESVDKVFDAIARTPGGNNKILKFATESLVKPVVKSGARISDVQTGKDRYAPGVKGVAELGTDAFNIGSMVYAPAKAGILAKGGKQALKVVPEAAARGAGAGAGINVVNQVADDRPGINPLEAAVSGALGGVANVGLPLLSGGISRMGQTAPKILASEVGAVGKNVNEPALPVVKGVGRTTPANAPKLQPAGAPPLKTRAAKVQEPPIIGASEPGRGKRLTNTASATLEAYGPEGAVLSRAAKAARDYKRQGMGKFFSDIPTVMGLKGDKAAQFVDTLDALTAGGKIARNLDPEIKKAVGEWEKAIPKPLQDAIAAGVPVAGDRGKYYFPRIYKNIEKQEVFDDLVEQTMQKNKVSREEAIKAVSYLRDSKIKRSGNLEKSRSLDIPGYEKNHQAIVDYVERAYERTSRAKHFGANDELINKMKAELQRRGVDVSPKSKFQKNLDNVRDDIEKTGGTWKASSIARKATATTSLGTAGISNATQLNNTAAIAGILRTGKGIVKWATSPEARREALRAGVGLSSDIKRVAEGTQGVSGKIATNIASPLFAQVEKFNREVSAIVGIDFAKHLAKKGDDTSMRMLRDKLGVKGKIGKKLSRDQLEQAARGLEEKSQFLVDPMDLPGWVNTPAGKLAAQFRTFGYKQTSFMYNEVAMEALRHGNFKPLMRFLAVGAPAGYAANEAKDFVKGKFNENKDDPSKPRAQKLLEGIGTGLNQVGATGLPGFAAGSLIQSAKFGTLPQGIVSQAGGPFVGNIVEGGTNLVKGQMTGNWDPLKKQGLRKIPTVGPLIANKTMPYKPKNGGIPAPGENATPAELNEQSEEIKKQMGERKTMTGNLQKLPNGKYAYTLEGETDVKEASDLKKAREAIAWHEFEKSGEKSKVIGDKHYYIDQNGNPQKEYKFKHDYDVETASYNLEMDIAKDAEDWATWDAVADKKIKALEKLRDSYNKEGQQDEVDKKQLEIENLKQARKKYAGYGGAFTKGRSGRGGGGGGATSTNTSGFKTASSGRSYTPKGIRVRSPGARTAMRTKKISVSKAPRV